MSLRIPWKQAQIGLLEESLGFQTLERLTVRRWGTQR
jgi:hypothetical protein